MAMSTDPWEPIHGEGFPEMLLHTWRLGIVANGIPTPVFCSHVPVLAGPDQLQHLQLLF